MFSRQPITIGITVLGLGLAIGVSGAVFTLMNAAVLRSDGVRDAGRAPRVMRTTPNGVSTAWGYDEYLQLRDAARQSRVEAWLTDAASYAAGTALPDDPPSIPIAFVTGGYMDALYARTAAGRILATADDDLSAPPVAVVSHAFWTRHLAADPATIGRTLRIGRVTATIVGIAERRFAAPFTNGTGVWMPISTYHVVHSGKAVAAGSRQPVNVVARLAPGADTAAAEAELTAIAGTFEISREPARRAGARFDQRNVLGRPGSQQFTVAIAVLTVIALVLLLACVNVASVLLANATTRQREIGRASCRERVYLCV